MKQRQDAWSEENDLLLAETVLRHVREGSTQLNAFEEVGDKLNRTSAACGFRWNAVVRHDYEKALQLAKKQRKQRMRALGKGQPVKKQLLYTPDAPSVDVEDFDEQEEQSMMSMSALESHMAEVMPADEDVSTSFTKQAQPAPVRQPVATQQAQATTNRLTMDQVIAFLQSYKTNNVQSEALKSENLRLKREVQELSSQNDELQKKVDRLEQDTVTVQEDYETLMKIMNRARKLVLFDEEDRTVPTTFKMDRNGNLEKMAE
ncbi:RsfA family transcriptional regulator [Metabacillus litoralis]|uniref:RsfA family transcriptional regulator n=1 Tax=Metabacillus litoralis TaxID=152268 RepID=UPI000EF616A7|nr:RsfA family transcriptional regulator [Metabacillus litoralis]MCM3162431.1 RsfA family transcriptional regulator [Metabacillus litoralis]UHA61255.1 RsfA family transcriptional regulator [Metabacillus litoralis]